MLVRRTPWEMAIALSTEEAFDQRLPGQTEVLGDVTQDAGQRAHPEGRVTRDGHVVLTAFGSGKPNVAAGLTGHSVAEVTERLREIVAGDVPRQSQAVMTSSRTKWSRMILGR